MCTYANAFLFLGVDFSPLCPILSRPPLSDQLAAFILLDRAECPPLIPVTRRLSLGGLIAAIPSSCDVCLVGESERKASSPVVECRRSRSSSKSTESRTPLITDCSLDVEVVVCTRRLEPCSDHFHSLITSYSRPCLPLALALLIRLCRSPSLRQREREREISLWNRGSLISPAHRSHGRGRRRRLKAPDLIFIFISGNAQ